MMSARRLVFSIALSISLACALESMSACSFDRSANDAHGCDEGCSVCHLGYCLVTLEEAATGSGGSGASSGSGNAGTSGEGGVGGSGAGGSGAGGSGAGGSGAVSGAGAGGSGAGGTGGNGGTAGMDCVPAPEVCNGADDNCNGAIDEDSDVPCYPAGVAGCTFGASGDFECKGVCAPGTQRCEGGVLSECTGFAGPAAEACDAAPAIDDDCDGTIDDGCECDAGETQECYGAPDRTAGIGPCRKGMQTCEGGQFGACMGEITPVAETCSNPGVDDNCDRVRDNVPMRGSICFDFTQRGICLTGTFMCEGSSLECVTPSPRTNEAACDGFDDDCDGAIDEDFPLNRDEDNCGSCGVRCSAGQQCCGGMCRTVETDEAHCGECNNGCEGLTCCNGDCVAIDSHDRCGGCNIRCEANEECCSSQCTPIDTPEHCGGCTTACGDNQECCDGLCSDVVPGGHCGGCDVPCGIGQMCCNGACVMTGNDNNNCGGCGIVCPESCPFCSMNECRDNSGLACL